MGKVLDVDIYRLVTDRDGSIIAVVLEIYCEGEKTYMKQVSIERG